MNSIMIAETSSPESGRAKPLTRARIRVFKAIAILIGLVFALAIGEAGLRVVEKAHIAQIPAAVPDPILGFKNPPNAPGHDAKGFRNSAAPSHADIVAIGDSQTWCVNVPAADAWPQQLGRLSGRSVYNMSVGGYGPDQYLMLSDQALDLSPATIVVGLYFGNDLYDAYVVAYRMTNFTDLRLAEPDDDLTHDTVSAHAEALWNEEKGFHNSYGRDSPINWGLWLREHTAIGRLLNRNGWWLGASDVDHEIDKAWAHAYPEHALVCEDMKIRTVLTSAYQLTGLDLDDPRIAEGLRITKLALLRIRQKTEGRANLMVLLIPTKELVYADVMRDKRRNQTYDRLTEMEILTEMVIKARRDVSEICARAVPGLSKNDYRQC